MLLMKWNTYQYQHLHIGIFFLLDVHLWFQSIACTTGVEWVFTLLCLLHLLCKSFSIHCKTLTFLLWCTLIRMWPGTTKGVECLSNNVLEMWHLEHEMFQKYANIQNMKCFKNVMFQTWNILETWHFKTWNVSEIIMLFKHKLF